MAVAFSGDGKLGMGNGDDWNSTALDGDDDGSELERGRWTKRPSFPRAGVASLASAESAAVSSWASSVVVSEGPGSVSSQLVYGFLSLHILRCKLGQADSTCNGNQNKPRFSNLLPNLLYCLLLLLWRCCCCCGAVVVAVAGIRVVVRLL